MNLNLTLLGQMIAFAFFVWFCMKYVWPPIIGAMNAREKKIADGLAAAEKGVKQQEESKHEADKAIAEAKAKAAEIITRAEKRGVEVVDEAKTTAKVEGSRIIEGAKDEIDRELNLAKEKLRGQVAELALAGAEKILDREINASTHAKMLNELAAKL